MTLYESSFLNSNGIRKPFIIIPSIREKAGTLHQVIIVSDIELAIMNNVKINQSYDDTNLRKHQS